MDYKDGSKRIKVSSWILLIALIVGSIFVLSALPALSTIPPLLKVYTLFLLLMIVFEFVVVILGIKYANDYSKANMLYILGIILITVCVISVVSNIIRGSLKFSDLYQFILPIIYTTGARKNKEFYQPPQNNITP